MFSRQKRKQIDETGKILPHVHEEMAEKIKALEAENAELKKDNEKLIELCKSQQRATDGVQEVGSNLLTEMLGERGEVVRLRKVISDLGHDPDDTEGTTT